MRALRSTTLLAAAWMLASAFLLTSAMLGGCTWHGWLEEPDPGLQRMLSQPRIDAFDPAPLPGGTAMQPPPEGTVPFGVPPATDQAPPTLADLERGRTRYDVTCATCHGIDGAARTVVAEDMELRPPPSLLDPRIVALSDDDLARVIAQGFGLMPSYAAWIAPRERRGVVLYVRALQLRERAPIAELTPAMRRDLEDATR